MNSLEGITGFDRKEFEKVHEEKSQVTSIRINPSKLSGSLKVLPFGEDLGEAPVPWSQFGYYLSKRPSFTFDPLFHAGCYYVQEASSMFLEQAFKQLIDLTQSIKVLDVSAAPGGKSTHIQSLISNNSLLVANEVIKGRSNVLADNIIKWGSRNVIVTNSDPKAFQRLPGYFDVIVVDAPCSGSGLFRRDEDAINEWSLNNVQLCSQRQQRILADVMPSLKENGLLIYSTCSYSKEEDEEIADWLVSEFEMKNEKLEIPACRSNVEGRENEWGIVETVSAKTNSFGYRFFPDKVKGEGFFIACFRKTSSAGSVRQKNIKPEFISSKEKNIINDWVSDSDLSFIKNNTDIIAIPSAFVQELYLIKHALNIQYAGVRVGEIMKDKLVPHHALALSNIILDEVTNTDLSYDDAIKYLQKQELSFVPAKQGWQTVSFKNFNIGWINALKNRINNYYPKELRILKQYNDTAFEN